MKKRIAAAVMTSVMAGMMMVTPTFAANTGSAHTDFSLYVANDPVYTVTVPETVTLNAKEHTLVPITASDVKNIPEGKKITVTLQKGNGTYGRLYLVGDKMNGAKPYMMTLNIKGTSGDLNWGHWRSRLKVWNWLLLQRMVQQIMKYTHVRRIIRTVKEKKGTIWQSRKAFIILAGWTMA